MEAYKYICHFNSCHVDRKVMLQKIKLTNLLTCLKKLKKKNISLNLVSINIANFVTETFSKYEERYSYFIQ